MSRHNRFEDNLKAVWGNNKPFRYVPMNNSGGRAYGWDVWDRKEDRWIIGKEAVAAIDPSELFFSDKAEIQPPARDVG